MYKEALKHAKGEFLLFLLTAIVGRITNVIPRPLSFSLAQPLSKHRGLIPKQMAVNDVPERMSDFFSAPHHLQTSSCANSYFDERMGLWECSKTRISQDFRTPEYRNYTERTGKNLYILVSLDSHYATPTD